MRAGIYNLNLRAYGRVMRLLSSLEARYGAPPTTGLILNLSEPV